MTVNLDNVDLGSHVHVILVHLGENNAVELSLPAVCENGHSQCSAVSPEMLQESAEILLPSKELADSAKYRLAKDKQRTLISRMIQRLKIAQMIHIHPQKVTIERQKTKSKPIWVPGEGQNTDFFHYNVSHDADLVAYAAFSHCIVGIDCMKIETRGGRPIGEFLTRMKAQCSTKEWEYIHSSKNSIESLTRFFENWTMKEAFLKAIGTGIYTDPDRLECTIREQEGKLQIALDRKVQVEFSFHFIRSLPGYMICICIGPESQAFEAYKDCIPKKGKIPLLPYSFSGDSIPYHLTQLTVGEVTELAKQYRITESLC